MVCVLYIEFHNNNIKTVLLFFFQVGYLDRVSVANLGLFGTVGSMGKYDCIIDT